VHGTYSLTDFSTTISAPSGADPRGWVRSDNVTSIVYSSVNHSIVELTMVGGQWQHHNLSEAFGEVGGTTPIGYKRHDSMSSIVHHGTDGHIHELALVQEPGAAWKDFDLTRLAGGPGGSNPFGYVRNDHISAVVYQGSDGHIHELALLPSAAWEDFDLTNLASAGVDGQNPAAYVRHDRTSVVVYRGSDGHIHELALDGANGRSWNDYDLSALAGASVEADGAPIGYVRHDSRSVVVYRGGDGHVHELALDAGVWSDWDLSKLSGVPTDVFKPTASVGRAGDSRVSYSTSEGDLCELVLERAGWRFNNITAEATPLQGSKFLYSGRSPCGFRRSDKKFAVACVGGAGGIREFLLVT
jgi:hypothetical protein